MCAKKRSIREFSLALLIILFLFDCESQENKNSRLTLDKYTIQLNSITTDIISNRDDEAGQVQIKINTFYDRYITKLKDFENDSDFETIDEKYSKSRDDLTNISSIYSAYLIARKKIILHMSNADFAAERTIAYAQEHDEWQRKLAMSSRNNGEFNLKMSTISRSNKLENLQEYDLAEF